ncbi:JNK-interacting protein 1 [Galendromus occidentalis]|uniref:JNK-interacting protein 1 n=1 Tax=Galendromus occidentalis TaxID=34638 RepID=A0AAJ7SHQ6_9ACAR|nr:JNK-interacting protein 1 [Galendromus occidentalis]
MERAQLIELYLRNRETAPVSKQASSNIQCYRLVQVETPVSPGQDDPEPEPILDQDDEVEVKNLRNTYYPFLTEPCDFLEHHPAEQDNRTLPDLKVSAKGRRRRKLPEIPKDKKPLEGLSLAEEFRAIDANTLVTPFSEQLYLEIDTSGNQPRSTFKYYKDQANEDERLRNIKSPTDMDESREKDGAAEDPPQIVKDLEARHQLELQANELQELSNRDRDSGQGESSPSRSSTISSSSSALCGSLARLRVCDATHRGIHRFVPRHPDEIAVDLGDPVYVIRECSIEDSWCEGLNLTTGRRGLFPNAYVTDVDYNEFDQCLRRERFLLHFLGSVEVSQHKGNSVLCQAIRKIIREANRAVSRSTGEPRPVPSLEPESPTSSEWWSSCLEDVPGHSCVLEVSEQGLRIVDRRSKVGDDAAADRKQDYFFNLKNVTFCGYHPTDHRYFGFISKHPLLKRFACHIFFAEDGARDVAASIGSAFERFYHKFMEVTFPTEDIYIDDAAV